MTTMEQPYQKIIKYINYQKIDVELNILKDIKEIINTNNNNLNYVTFNQLKRIKKLNNILSNVNYKEYYIFILEIIPNYILRNLYRSFSYKWNKYLNQKKDIINKRNLLYNINDINTKTNIKDILIEELENLNKYYSESINFFICTINDFFI
tara:strand:- start:93 stop:548 length:456 start_codon:yes stop_codon:yes gene_type:complete